VKPHNADPLFYDPRVPDTFRKETLARCLGAIEPDRQTITRRQARQWGLSPVIRSMPQGCEKCSLFVVIAF